MVSIQHLNMHFVLMMIGSMLLMVRQLLSETTTDYKSEFALAHAHYRQVRWNIQCSTPRPRVVRVSTPELKLVPPATILHRCGDSAGCCDSLLERCVAKTREKLKMYFFIQPPNGRRRINRKLKVQNITLTNHTSCHCVDKRNIPK